MRLELIDQKILCDHFAESLINNLIICTKNEDTLVADQIESIFDPICLDVSIDHFLLILVQGNRLEFLNVFSIPNVLGVLFELCVFKAEI